MSFVLALLVVVGFGVLLERLKIATSARYVARLAVETIGVLRDARLDDRVKERESRQRAMQLLGAAAVIVGSSLVAFAVPLGVVWFLDIAGFGSLPDVTKYLVRVDFLLFAAVLGTAAYLLTGVAARR